MLTQENNWIKTSDRKPTMADLPIYTTNVEHGLVHQWGSAIPLLPGYTHWMPAPKLPAPPPRVLTQAEQDTEESATYAKGTCVSTSAIYYLIQHAYKAGMRAERKHVLPELDRGYIEESTGACYGEHKYSSETSRRLRKRLEVQS